MNKQGYIYSISSITILALWFFLLCSPFIKEEKQLKSQISDGNAQLTDFEETITLLPKFISERKQLRQRKEFLNSMLYTKEEVISLFKRLKQDASSQHLIVTEITPPIEELLQLNSIIPDSTVPQFLNIGVSVSGSYIEFAKFIKQIEKEPYFRGINQCRISGSKDFNQELKLHIGFKALLGRLGEKS